MKSEKKENPSAFKHWYNSEMLRRIAAAIEKHYPDFPTTRFLKVADSFPQKEMKDRVKAISHELRQCLPHDYPKSLKILVKAAQDPNLKSFDLWPFTEFVQSYGLSFFPESLEALYELTQKFTAEFTIRPFLIENRRRCFAVVKKWTQDPNVHVRRLCSEGTRPRLPWGLKLKDSIQDPSPGLEILEILKFDSELYVRKSIANHLNDITKDHPEIVIQTLKKWQSQARTQEQKKNLSWIQHHALRTLIKKGDPKALKLMGFSPSPKIKAGLLKLEKKNYRMMETLSFAMTVTSLHRATQSLAIDYVIEYQRAKGSTSKKVFKLKVVDLAPGSTYRIEKKHQLKPVTTRRHYTGKHRVFLQVNGQIVGSAAWNLKV